MTDHLEVKAAFTVSEEGQIEGIAWPFGTEDRVGDMIQKGAFAASTGPLPMLWAHDQSQVVGVWDEITESPSGLTVKGRLLIDEVARAREVRALIQSKAASGLSIGFVTKSATPRQRGRTISSLDLFEVSIVAVPCHAGARITSAKSADNPAGSPAPTHEKGTPVEPETTPAIPAQTTPANDSPGIDLKAFEAMQKRLDQLETRAARPHGVTVTGAAVQIGDETKGFANYLRTGDTLDVKTLSTSSTGATVLAPEAVAASILEKVSEFSPMRGLAQSIQMGGPLLKLPRLVTEIVPASVAENALKPESEPTFEEIEIRPFGMGVMVPVSKVLLEDSQVDLNGYLSNHIARRFGQLEASWFITGNGTTQAEGVLVSEEVQEIEGGVNTGVQANDLIDLFYSVATAYSVNGAWFMNRATMAQVRKLQTQSGDYLWQPALAAGQPPSILGRPVYEAVDMPDPVAGNTPVVFGDFASGYAIADRIGFEVIRDEITGAQADVVKFIARRRVGGRVIMGEAISKLTLAAAA